MYDRFFHVFDAVYAYGCIVLTFAKSKTSFVIGARSLPVVVVHDFISNSIYVENLKKKRKFVFR